MVAHCQDLAHPRRRGHSKKPLVTGYLIGNGSDAAQAQGQKRDNSTLHKTAISLACVDMLNGLPITCLLVSIGSGINTRAED